jgi:hypothetical protein
MAAHVDKNVDVASRYLIAEGVVGQIRDPAPFRGDSNPLRDSVFSDLPARAEDDRFDACPVQVLEHAHTQKAAGVIAEVGGDKPDFQGP